jgi:hypothetical protein
MLPLLLAGEGWGGVLLTCPPACATPSQLPPACRGKGRRRHQCFAGKPNARTAFTSQRNCTPWRVS